MNPKDKHADWLLRPTANDLADGLAKMYIEKDVNGLFNKRIQNMLRQFGLAESIIKQQQLEIEALKKQLAFMEGEYPEPTIMAKMMEVDLVRQQQAEMEELTEKYNNLKQWERRYLDVIKSLTKDQKQALNEELRTYNGKRTWDVYRVIVY